VGEYIGSVVPRAVFQTRPFSHLYLRGRYRDYVFSLDTKEGADMTQEPRQLFPKTRRAFLGAVGQTAAVMGLAMGSAATYSATHKKSARSDGSKDVGILNVALALEHEGIAAYRLAGASGLLKPATLQVAKVFMGHHEQHRDSLASLVSKAGGKPVAPQSDTQYAQALNLAALKTEGDVLVLATRLERGAASAYVGQVAALHDFKLAQLFSRLASDEAAHWATLNNAQGLPISAKAYLFG
jgi:rubrerythrin